MANAQIFFFPIRKPIDPAPDPEAYYQLDVSLSVFEHAIDISTKNLKTVAGGESSSLFYITPTYNVTVLPKSEAGDPDPTTEEMEMFLYSVVAKEKFILTNLDEGDRLMDVQLVSRWTKPRQNDVLTDRFVYSFQVREVIA